uniref:R3H domain-containing protein n=1 Tax=Takifugu rubripes TaxID=31033 RepID=H2UUH4_TAKRU
TGVAMNCNSYLPKQECQFLHLVMDELDTFHSNSNRIVLLFPPLPSRLRYLVHNHVEELPDLTTFSVGERECRRVVVCYADLSFVFSKCVKRKHEEKVIAKPKTSNQARHRGSKRPDKPLYMPRAVRERLSLQNAQQPPEDKTLTSPAAGSDGDQGSGAAETKQSSEVLRHRK